MLWQTSRRWRWLVVVAGAVWVAGAGAAQAEEGRQGPLVSAAWLAQHRAEVLVLDASVTPQHRAGHIPGSVSADLYRYGPSEPTRAAMEQRIQSWGINAGQRIVVYDQGADMMAARLFHDLYFHGYPVEDLLVLDGGLARWRAHGGAVTQEPTPKPVPGTYRIGAQRDDARVRLPEFLVATGDRAGNAIVDALEPAHHWGGAKFFDRAGHIPGALSLPHADFFNADKTFKSADEMRRLARYAGIRPEQVVHSYCGGGVAAAVPWFALQFIAGQPRVRLYLGSLHEWLRDERGLPLATYDAPQLARAPVWLAGWNAPMLRMFGVARLNLVDVRPAPQYAQGHIPYALNIEAATFRTHLGDPKGLAAILGPAGVNPADEVVVMAEGGLTPDAALAFLAFEHLGHAKVSVLMDSVDEWGLRGGELSRQATLVGPPKSPRDAAVPAATYDARPPAGVIVTDPKATRGDYPKVFVAMGRTAAARTPEGPVVRLPYGGLLLPGGSPRPAAELWKLITQAGVPRHAEVFVFADDPAEAAVGYTVLRLMGWPDVKVWVD